MNRPHRSLVLIAAGGAAVLALTGCRAAVAPTDPKVAADFTLTKIADQPGAAFTVIGELAGSRSQQEILTTNWIDKADPNFGNIPDGGEVKLYRKTGSSWTPTTVISASENIRQPNRPTLTDVDGDGRTDFIQPAGWFLNSALGDTTGSITWWRNNGNGSFSRNDVATNVGGSYEGVVHADLDDDGVKDIVSTFQDYGNPFVSPATPPEVYTHFFKGKKNGTFAPAVTLCECGGPLPVVFDVNADGKLDIAVAQYLGVTTVPNATTGTTDESFIWLENVSKKKQALSPASFEKHVIARGLGESVQILPVDNIDGKGKYGAIGINQVNTVLGDPNVPPQMVRLTPGSDIRAEWDVSVVADGFTPETFGFGATSPGPATEGDIDGDGDIDLIGTGGADRSVYWIERKGDGSWVQRNIGEEFGRPGANWGYSGAAVGDLDRDGRNEVVISPYNEGAIYILERKAGTGGRFPASPHRPDRLLPY
jgi:hypothetical protein